MSLVAEVKGQLAEAQATGAQCQALLAEASGYLGMASTQLAAALMGADDADVMAAWETFLKTQERVDEVAAQVGAALEGIGVYLAYLDSGPGGGAGSAAPAPPPTAAAAQASPTPSSRAVRVRRFIATEFVSPATARRHVRDHGYDFGVGTVEQYVDSASAFLRRAQQLEFPARVDSSGRVRIYDPATNVFAAFDSDGTLVTYFKPTSPTYWERNVGRWGDPLAWDSPVVVSSDEEDHG